VVSLALFPVGRMGAIYFAAAWILGALFVRHAFVLFRTGSAGAAMGLFRYSITYLALLFAAVGVDAVVNA
jgi:protoheme IX farnesyltransferase